MWDHSPGFDSPGRHDNERGTIMSWAIYLRVSTSGQEEHGIGLEVQEADCRAFLAERGLTAGEVFTDVCSGALLDRDGLADMLVAARDGDLQGVVFKRLDRLARDTLVQEYLLTEFAKAKLMVRSCSPAENAMLDDPDADPDPSRKLIRIIASAVAEYERHLITARTQAAKRRLRAQGKHVDGPLAAGMRKNAAGAAEFLPHLVPIVEHGLRMRDVLRCTYDAVGEFWFSEGYLAPKRADGTWSPRGVLSTLDRARKWGYQPSEFLSAQAGLFCPGGRM